ncbi:MAG: hypothetical protein AB2L24_07840 [Mangrovibacterium sp.]
MRRKSLLSGKCRANSQTSGKTCLVNIIYGELATHDKSIRGKDKRNDIELQIKIVMKKYILLLATVLCLGIYAQNSEAIYTVSGNTIITKSKFIDSFYLENSSNLTPYVSRKTETIIPSSSYGSFSLEFLKFNGYESEPGICNVIRIKKNDIQILNLESSNGFGAISSYVDSENADFSLVQVASNTYVLIFNEWIYASQPSMISIVLIRNGQVGLVFNKPGFVNSISKSNGNLNISLQSNTVEYRGDNNTPPANADTHSIWWDGNVLKFQ